MRKLLFVTALVAAACAEQDGNELAGGTDGTIIHTTADAGITTSNPSTARPLNPVEPDSSTAVCGLLPNDDSACAHACDRDALMAYIPEGTCASFTCTLSDGSLYRTGGCNR